MARKIPVFGRVLDAPALYAFAYGEIASSLYYALGITAAYALSMMPVVFAAMGVLFALAAAAYAEGSATIPEPGGSAAYSRRAFNDLVGFVAGWATVLDYVISISLAALFIPFYAAGAFDDPERFSPHEAAAIAVAIVVGVAAMRIWRHADAYAVGLVITIVDIVVQVGLAVLGLAFLFSWDALQADINLGVEPTWSALAFSLPLAMVAFTGLEKVAALSGMAKVPERDLPDAIRSSVVTVILVYAGVATAAASGFHFVPDPDAPAGYSSELTTTWLNAPLLGLVDLIGTHLPDALATGLRVIVGLTATAILLLAIATSFSGCGRLAVAMTEFRMLPGVFARRGRRSFLPTWAFAGVALLACGFLIVGAAYEEEVLALASLYSFGILIALTLTQAAIVWLRIAEPDMPRPFTMRGNVPVAGRSIPLPAVLGAIGTFSVWVLALGTHPGARIVGMGWMLVGLCVYAAVRVRAGEPLMSRFEEEPPPEEMELDRATIVVPLERLDAVAEEAMATACRLAAESGGSLVGVTGIKVPVRYPLEQEMAEEEAAAAAVQALAERLAGEYGVPYRGVVARTRNPGRLIVDAATEADAQLIVMGAPQKRRLALRKEEQFFGETADFVLRKAHCRVIVTHFPSRTLAEEAADAPATV